MQFTCETQYDGKALAVMAKVLRKTMKKRWSRFSRIVGWTIVGFGALSVLLSVALDAVDMTTFLAGAGALLLAALQIFEDRLNGWIAKKQMIPGADRAVTVFSEEGFVTTAAVGRTEWRYDSITVAAETKDFFVFAFGKNHGQLHDKRALQGGTAEEFRRFLEGRTGRPVLWIQ